MFIALLFYAFKATLGIEIVSIKYHVHGAEQQQQPPPKKPRQNTNKKQLQGQTKTKTTGKQTQEKWG